MTKDEVVSVTGRFNSLSPSPLFNLLFVLPYRSLVSLLRVKPSPPALTALFREYTTLENFRFWMLDDAYI